MRAKPLILLGTGGHAKVVAEALRLSGREILGVTDPNSSPGSNFFGVKVLGGDEAIYDYSPEEVELVNGVGALPGKARRWEIGEQMRRRGYRFASVIHPSAVIAKDVELSEGTQVMAGAVIQPSVKIGVDTIVNTGVCIDHDCEIGANCHLAPGVILSGEVYIGDSVHIGTGTSVIQKLNIGSGTFVAAGSILYKDIPAGVKYKQLRTEQIERLGG